MPKKAAAPQETTEAAVVESPAKPEPSLEEMTAESVGKDLLGALINELKLLPEPWQRMAQHKQEEVIWRLRARVESQIRHAVHVIASAERTVVVGTLDQITIKDGVKAVVTIGRGAEALHEFCDAQGKQVLVVVAGAADHTVGMYEIQGEADQRAMDLGHEYREDDGGGMTGAEVDADGVIRQPDEAEAV